MAGDPVQVIPIPRNSRSTVFFDRLEFDAILNTYGRGQLAGAWRDYAIGPDVDVVVFCFFRRASEQPLYRLEKRPSLQARQGQWALYGLGGQVLKRGHELRPVLEVLERKLLKVVG
jgi:Protein of unknown function (DUF2794)